MNFLSNTVYSFLIAIGVIIGASLFAGIGAIINNHPPLKTMYEMAASLKIWAVAIAIGGTFTSFEVFEKGLIKGDIRSLIKQAIYIVVALIGANIGYEAIKMVKRCGELWSK